MKKLFYAALLSLISFSAIAIDSSSVAPPSVTFQEKAKSTGGWRNYEHLIGKSIDTGRVMFSAIGPCATNSSSHRVRAKVDANGLIWTRRETWTRDAKCANPKINYKDWGWQPGEFPNGWHFISPSGLTITQMLSWDNQRSLVFFWPK